MSGAAEYETFGSILCGVVVCAEADVPYTDASFTLIDATTTDISDTEDGDSGAPYGNGGAFIGIHAAEGPGRGQTALTKVYNVAAALGGNLQY
jgi:hypothetical protein